MLVVFKLFLVVVTYVNILRIFILYAMFKYLPILSLIKLKLSKKNKSLNIICDSKLMSNLNSIYLPVLVEFRYLVPIDLIYFIKKKSFKAALNYSYYNMFTGYSLSILIVNCNYARAYSRVWPIFSWYEREVMDFIKTEFAGSWDNRRLLLPYSTTYKLFSEDHSNIINKMPFSNTSIRGLDINFTNQVIL